MSGGKSPNTLNAVKAHAKYLGVIKELMLQIRLMLVSLSIRQFMLPEK
jgi:hypothetical protein